MRVTITYYVPVYVTVDLDTQTVDSVVVDDEADLSAAVTVHDADDATVTVGTAQKALDVAREREWPEWRVGR